MQIHLDLGENAKAQCVAAGFANIQEYVHSLLKQDRDRLAIQQGYEDVKAGRIRPFAEFDAEMRQTLDIQPDA